MNNEMRHRTITHEEFAEAEDRALFGMAALMGECSKTAEEKQTAKMLMNFFWM